MQNSGYQLSLQVGGKKIEWFHCFLCPPVLQSWMLWVYCPQPMDPLPQGHPWHSSGKAQEASFFATGTAQLWLMLNISDETEKRHRYVQEFWTRRQNDPLSVTDLEGFCEQKPVLSCEVSWFWLRYGKPRAQTWNICSFCTGDALKPVVAVAIHLDFWSHLICQVCAAQFESAGRHEDADDVDEAFTDLAAMLPVKFLVLSGSDLHWHRDYGEEGEVALPSCAARLLMTLRRQSWKQWVGFILSLPGSAVNRRLATAGESCQDMFFCGALDA